MLGTGAVPVPKEEKKHRWTRKIKANYELAKKPPGGFYGDSPPPPPGLKGPKTTSVTGRVHQDYFVTPTGEPPNGVVAHKLPHKMTLEAGKTYAWCVCGLSKNQPLCDGKHFFRDHKGFHKPRFYRFRPKKFTVEETREYYLCQCKQTSTRPFCDGSHRKLWTERDGYIIKE